MSIDMFGDSHLKLTSEYQDSNESQAAEELFRSMVMGFWAQMQPSMDANFSNKFQMCTTLERYTCGTFRHMQTSTNKKWLLFVHWAPGTLPHYSTSVTLISPHTESFSKVPLSSFCRLKKQDPKWVRNIPKSRVSRGGVLTLWSLSESSNFIPTSFPPRRLSWLSPFIRHTSDLIALTLQALNIMW